MYDNNRTALGYRLLRDSLPVLLLVLLLGGPAVLALVQAAAETASPSGSRSEGSAPSSEEQPPSLEESLKYYTANLDRFEKLLKQPSPQDSVLEDVTKGTLEAGKFAQGCITRQEPELAKAQQSLDSLGDVGAASDIELVRTRTKLDTDKSRLEQQLAQCRLIDVRARNLQAQSESAKQNILKERLLAPSDSVLTLLLRIIEQPGSLAAQATRIVTTLTTLPLNFHNLGLALAYGISGMLAGLVWSLYKRRSYRQTGPTLESNSPVLAATWRSLIRSMPSLLFFGLISLSLHYNSSGVPLIQQLVLILLVFSLCNDLLRTLLRPQANIPGYTPVPPSTSRKLHFWAKIFLFTVLLGALFQSPLFNNPEQNSLIGLIRTGLGTLIGLALMRLIWILRKHLKVIQQLRLHLFGILLLLTAIVALWLGYHNFAEFLFVGILGTLFILLISSLMMLIPVEIFDGMDEGRALWQQKLRKRLGLSGDQIMPGLIWLRLVHVLVVSALTLMVLMRLWGMSEQSFQLMLTRIASGIEIGGFLLQPLRILYGLLLMALLIGMTHVLKRSLASSWLKRTNLSRGARDATTTITGYAGILLALMIGLSVAGIQFSNLAIIAGALSVGIGFGLQNIVSNFISGLILLFERPIRRGDWIRVGTAEGYVKDISIRSTTIETFDRADIIVPNSELIAGQVTNMMLHNQYGRIIIPVRLAYGSDTEQVMALLRKVGENHPLTLKEHGKQQVQALFRGFGDSALLFELRCHIRDVEATLMVISELNLAIDKAFRAAGIVMPYPQQTVHIATIPGVQAPMAAPVPPPAAAVEPVPTGGVVSQSQAL